MYLFLTGALMMGFFAAALFFLNFWRRTGDRFFALFSAAWWMLGLERLILGVLNQPEQFNPGIYLARLAAFALIAIAIVDKNAQRIRR